VKNVPAVDGAKESQDAIKDTAGPVRKVLSEFPHTQSLPPRAG